MLLPARLFLAAGWSRAAAEKLLDDGWWRGDQVRMFIAAEHHHALPFARPTMRHLLEHGAAAVALIVVAAELLCGIALLAGVRLRTALWVGVTMNAVFVLAGRVNPSAFYLVLEIVLLFAIACGTIGSPRAARRRLHPGLAAGAWGLAAIALTPFVHMMAPKHMIDDPALMLAFLAALVALGHVLMWLLGDQRTQHLDRSRWIGHVVRWSRAGSVSARRSPR